jgi:hypothetical protein
MGHGTRDHRKRPQNWSRQDWKRHKRKLKRDEKGPREKRPQV